MAENARKEALVVKKDDKLYLALALLCVWVPIFMGAFDKDKPASSTSLRSSNPEILANWDALETALAQDHEFSTGGTNSGKHEVLTMEEEASAGASSTNEGHLQIIDGGSQPELAFTSEDGDELQFTKDGDLYSSDNLVVDGTSTLTGAVTANGGITLGAGDDLIGSATSDITMNTDKFTVAGATGNTVIAGTLGVTGVTTLSGGLAATTMSGALAMGTNKITGLGASTTAGDAVRYEQVFNSLAGATDSIGETTIGDLEIKWGKKTVSGTTNLDFTDEGLSDFSNACFQAFPVSGKTAGSGGEGIHTYSLGTDGFTMSFENASNVSPVRWFAIGR